VAHHNNTSESVLAAPLPSVGYLSRADYANRWERRHFVTQSGMVLTIPKAKRAPALNVPYIKPRSTR
jgi:hypothetical protein